MTVYARSDVASVTVSRSHEGCGQVHARPVKNGAPVKQWALTCPACETYLSHDPLWSVTLAEVPSTPDEDTARDNVQKSTARSREDIMALALAKIAGLPVAEFLAPMIGQAASAGTQLCSLGHENFPAAKFCAECGEKMSTAPAVITAAVEPEPESEPEEAPAPAPARAARRQPAAKPRVIRAGSSASA